MKTVIMWLSIFLVIMAVTIAGIIYMCRVICRFCVVKRLTGESRWKKILIFRLLFGLIGRIIRRKNIKEIPFDLQSLCAVAVTVVYLSAGYYLCHHVWETDYSLQTDKEIDNLHIVMFADSHVGATFDGNGFAGHIESIKNENPDLVLIPGDFVDSATKKQDIISSIPKECYLFLCMPHFPIMILRHQMYFKSRAIS